MKIRYKRGWGGRGRVEGYVLAAAVAVALPVAVVVAVDVATDNVQNASFESSPLKSLAPMNTTCIGLPGCTAAAI